MSVKKERRVCPAPGGKATSGCIDEMHPDDTKSFAFRQAQLIKGSDHIRQYPTAGMEKKEWLELRKATVGGSEAGTILGMNPFQSSYALWNEKMGITEPFEGNLATECGTFMEKFVADKFTEISGYAVKKSNYLWYNDNYQGAHASPDRLVYHMGDSGKAIGKPIAGLECKTTSAFRLKKFHGVDFPMQYYAQCVHYMMVTEIRVWYLAVLVGNQEYHIFRLVRDDGLKMPVWCEGQLLVEDDEIKALYEAEKEFVGLMERRTPPAVDGAESSTDAVKQVTGKSRDNEPLDMSGLEAIIKAYLLEKSEAKAAEERAEGYANQIRLAMGEHSHGVCGSVTIDYKTQTSSRMDTVRLLKDHPEMAVYKKASESRPLKVVEK